MAQQQDLSCTEWHPTFVLHPEYHDYAVVIMDRPMLWEPEKMLAVWAKSKLTVTVNGGTKIWMSYLLRLGIDISNGLNKQYVPNLIIMNTMDISLAGGIPTIVEQFASFGSTILYVPDQYPEDYIRVLHRISDCIHHMKIDVKEMYVFAKITSPNEVCRADMETLYKTNGKVNGIQIIRVAHLYFMWMLHRDVHKIHVPKRQVLLKSTCGLLPDPTLCKVTRCSTNGLERNIINASLADLLESPVRTSYMEEMVTVETDSSIIWVMGLNIAEEVLPKALNELTNESVHP